MWEQKIKTQMYADGECKKAELKMIERRSLHTS